MKMPDFSPGNGCLRGQFSTLDALVALSGMTLALLLSLGLFSTLYDGIASSQDTGDMEIKSFYALEQLLSPGDPPVWQYLPLNETSNFGIESESGVLDGSKIAALSSLIASNYSMVQERLGLSRYNFSLEILDYYNGSSIYALGNVNVTGNLRMQRVSALNGSLVRVRMVVSK